MIEEWRDIVGLKGFYQLSNLKRLRSLPRHDGIHVAKPPKLLKLQVSKKYGLYTYVTFEGTKHRVDVDFIYAKLFAKE